MHITHAFCLKQAGYFERRVMYKYLEQTRTLSNTGTFVALKSIFYTSLYLSRAVCPSRVSSVLYFTNKILL